MAIQFKNLVDVFEQRTGAIATDAYTLTVSTEQTSGATPNPGTGGLKVQYNDGTNDHGFGLVAGTSSSDFLTSGPMHFYTNSDLDTKSATGFAMAIDNFGKVGIGTAGPSTTLHVAGSSIIANSTIIDPDSYNNTVIAGGIADGSGWAVSSAIGGNAGAGNSWAIGTNTNNLYMGYGDQANANSLQTFLQVNGRNVGLVPTSGNVGINTTGPAEKLQVVGNIGAGDGTYNGGVYANSSSTAVDTNWGFDFLRTTGVSDYSTRLKYYPVTGETRKGGIWNSRNNNWVLYGDSNNTPNVIIPSGNVGIGVTSPDQKLHLEESDTTSVFLKTENTAGALLVGNNSAGNSFVSSQTSGKDLLFETANTERLRIKSDGSIQQGNSSATGQYAAAFGQNNTASSLDAFSTGELNTSSGRQSFTAGFDNLASGNASFAVGGGTTASGENSFAACGTTVASGISSAAFGAFSEATATNAFAINGDNTASGESSFALGVSSSAQALGSIASGLNCSTGAGANGAFAGGVVSNANNQFSIAYGDVANASGRVSQALGYIVNATGNYSFAQGFNNTASGQDAAVFGQQNTVSGAHSITSGFLNTTRNYSSATFGSFNGNVSNSIGSDQFMFGRYLNPPRDNSGTVSSGCVVVGEHNAYLNRVGVKFAVGTGPGVGAEQDSFTVLKDGNVLMEQIVNKNYSSDTAAAAGGVPVGGIYHNAGDLKIRLT